MNYKIISDGCCDLTKEVIEQYNLHIIPFYISFDEETYYKEIEEIGIREVYERMVGNPDVYPKTSLPSVQNYIDVFTEYVKEGIPVICICFTPSLSGSYNCACNAREIVCEDYPDAKIAVINSEAGTVSQGLMVIEAGRMCQNGVPYEQCVDILEKMKKTNRIFFTVGNTDYLKHGGRIGKLAGIAAGALGIKPMITLKEGEIFSSGLARGRVRSMKKVVDMTREYLDEVNAKPGEYSFCIGYGYDYEEAVKFREMLKNLVKERLGIEKIGIYQIGATIGVHTGPYPIGIGIIKHAVD